MADERIYAHAAEWMFDDELGDAQSFGWYGLIENIDEELVARLKEMAHEYGYDPEDFDDDIGKSAIVEITPSYFHHVVVGSKHDIERLWRRIEREYEKFLEDES